MRYMAEVYVLFHNNTWEFHHIEIPKWMFESLDAEMVDTELFDQIYKENICSLKVRRKYIV
jgi:hypothetical protein